MEFILGTVAGLAIEFKFGITGFIWAWVKSKFAKDAADE